MEIRKPNLSSAAVILKKRLAAQGLTISHTEALEHAAVMEGYQSYQAYQAHQKEMENWEAPVLVLEAPDEAGTDYRFIGTNNQGVWIRMRNINVKLLLQDEGVVVDMYASGAEDDESFASTYAFYSEAAQVLLERAQELDDARQQVKRILGYEKVKVEKSSSSGMWTWKQGKQRASEKPFATEWEACEDAYETLFV
jgi:DNA polymerase III delta prime subunit